MHNDFDAAGEEEEVVICFYRNLDLEENLLLRKDKLHNCKYILDGLFLLPVSVFNPCQRVYIILHAHLLVLSDCRHFLALDYYADI